MFTYPREQKNGEKKNVSNKLITVRSSFSTASDVLVAVRRRAGLAPGLQLPDAIHVHQAHFGTGQQPADQLYPAARLALRPLGTGELLQPVTLLFATQQHALDVLQIADQFRHLVCRRIYVAAVTHDDGLTDGLVSNEFIQYTIYVSKIKIFNLFFKKKT